MEPSSSATSRRSRALLSLIGRPVLVVFSGAGEGPFISGIVSGRGRSR
jgi:S1-C subfamily serine protease